MNVVATPLAGVVTIAPDVFHDERGCFLETFQQQRFQQAGIETRFVQENLARSRQGVLRGLHYQLEHPQGKLIQVVQGEIYDVALDLSRGSSTFGQWFATVLSDTNRRQLVIPPHCAHGYCVLSETADVVYKCTDFYYPQHERTIAWNDSDLKIEWPLAAPVLSEKDRRGLAFASAPCFP